MLEQGVEIGAITQNEAELFDQVHTLMDEFLTLENISGMDTGIRADALPLILDVMVDNDVVTQKQAETFLDVHERLIEEGLMQ